MSEAKSTRRDRRLLALTLVTLGAAAMRMIPHPWNVTPVAGLALFGGAHLRDRRLAFGIPLAAMLSSDLVLGLLVYGSAGLTSVPFVYGSFALMVGLGRLLAHRRSVASVGGAAVAAALLFYLITNFGVWVAGSLYPRTPAGLVTCYMAALPYLRNAIVGNLVYSGIFFGGFALAERQLPWLRRKTASLEASS